MANSNPLLFSERYKKIVIIGAGEIGTKLAQRFADGKDADKIVLYNRVEDPKAEEEAPATTPKKLTSAEVIKKKENQRAATIRGIKQAQIIQARSVFHQYDPNLPLPDLEYSNDLEEALKGADLVIVTAGAKRVPGQAREALIKSNAEVILPFAEAAGRLAPDAVHIMVTNPVDALTGYYQRAAGLPQNKVVGLSGELDTGRLIQSIAEHLRVDPSQVLSAKVVGLHTDKDMVPLLGNVRIKVNDPTDYSGKNEVSLDEYITHMQGDIAAEKQAIVDKVKEEIVAETMTGGKKFLDLTGVTDSIGPAAATYKMAIDVLAGSQGHGNPTLCSAMGEDGVFRGRLVEFNKDRTYQPTKLQPAMNTSEKATLGRYIDVYREDPASSLGQEAGKSGRAM